MATKRQHVIFTGVLAGVALVAALIVRTLGGGGNIITLTAEGFEPRELRIRVGETVTFVTERNEPFWPASDFHPQHTAFPEFDPKTKIEPGASWSFTFDRAGTWRYHDHLSANDRGTIIVGDAAAKTAVPADAVDCARMSDEAGRNECFDGLMDRTVQGAGITAGLELAKRLYESEPNFTPICHTLMHRVGAVAYEDFRAGKDVPTTPETALCEYGFYHGFAEELAKTDGDPALAGKFCTLAVKTLGAEYGELSSRCYHGFGHGSVEIDDTALWGDERAMVRPALAVCEEIADTSERLFQCATGAFDAIGIAYFSGEFELKMNTEDPFWLCRDETNAEVRRACYISLDPALLLAADLDVAAAAKHIAAIMPVEDAAFTMGSLALPPFWISNHSGPEAAAKMRSWYLEKGLETCRSFSAHLREPCIRSIAYALSVHEVRSENYRDGLLFCRSSILAENERTGCLSSVWNAVRHMYPRSEVATICEKEGRAEDKPHCVSG